MSADPLVVTERLSRRYGDRAALTDLDLTVRPGEIFGLLGPNGAGKSTTLNLLMGFIRPSAGRAHILGMDCTHDAVSVRRVVGHMPEEPVLYDNLTGREVLAFVLKIRGESVRARLSALTPVIERLAFGEEIDELVAGYSMGMRKKLALLVAFAHAPRVLLLDEPTNGLDPVVAREVRRLLQEHTEAGGAVLLSTHLLDVAQRVCGRIGILSRGTLRALGTPGDVLASAGPSHTSLEEAFLALTAAASTPDPGGRR